MHHLLYQPLNSHATTENWTSVYTPTWSHIQIEVNEFEISVEKCAHVYQRKDNFSIIIHHIQSEDKFCMYMQNTARMKLILLYTPLWGECRPLQ